eukprot:g22244.t1
MRCAQRKKGPARKGIENESTNSAPPSEELKEKLQKLEEPPSAPPKRRRTKQAENAPRLPLQEIRQASRKSAEA